MLAGHRVSPVTGLLRQGIHISIFDFPILDYLFGYLSHDFGILLTSTATVYYNNLVDLRGDLVYLHKAWMDHHNWISIFDYPIVDYFV